MKYCFGAVIVTCSDASHVSRETVNETMQDDTPTDQACKAKISALTPRYDNIMMYHVVRRDAIKSSDQVRSRFVSQSGGF